MIDPRKLVKQLTDQGASVKRGGQHLKLFDVNGRLIGILPAGRCHDSHRDFKNVISQCRRAGFDV